MIDHAFGAVEWREQSGGGRRARARVTDPAGGGASIEWGPECPWVQVHTADLPPPQPNRLGLALEPMTCPPDAFNSGVDLISLQPGATHRAEWVIAAW
jgi:aldose 1-epimerase